jgi:hypothetical protein
LIKNDDKGRIKILENPKTEDWVSILESKVTYDITEHENDPASVLRKCTDNPCY